MSINIITGFLSSSREHLDKRSGPYASVSAALSALDTNSRVMGLPIYIITDGTQDDAGNYITGTVQIYSFMGGIDDEHLIEITSELESGDYTIFGNRNSVYEIAEDTGMVFKKGTTEEEIITAVNSTTEGGFHGLRYVEKYKTVYASARGITAGEFIICIFADLDDLSNYTTITTSTVDSSKNGSDQILYSAHKDKLYIVPNDSGFTSTFIQVWELDPSDNSISLVINEDVSGTGLLYPWYPPTTLIDNYLFVGAGYYTTIIFKFDLDDYTLNDYLEISQTGGQTIHGLTTDGEKIWATSYSAATSEQSYIARIDPSDMSLEDIQYTTASGLGASGGAGITDDIVLVGDYLYSPLENFTVGGILKVNKNDLTEQIVLQVPLANSDDTLYASYFDGIWVWYSGTNNSIGKYSPETKEAYLYENPFTYNINEIRTDGQRMFVSGFDTYPVTNTGYVGRTLFPTEPIKKVILDSDGNKIYEFDYSTGSISTPLLSGTNTGDNAVNTLYSGLVSNVSTNLSEGTTTATSVDVNSSDGTNATIAQASSSRAGVLSSAKFDEIVANTLKVSDINHNVDTNLSNTPSNTEVTIESSDGNNTSITAASTSQAGVMTKAIFDEHVLNNAKVSNVDETLTTLGLAANILKYTDEDGTETDLDLSLYLDDTNLARLTSGSLNGTTGIATFTRDDASTFTIDMSAFLDAITLNNTLTSTSTTEGLTAAQGKVLKDLIDGINPSTGTNTGDQDLSGYLLNTTDTLTGTLTVTGDIGLGGTGLYATSHSLNIDGTGLAIKNDTAGSSNNWSTITNSATVSSSNLVFTTGVGIALTLAHNKNATFAGDVSANNLSGTNTGDQDLSPYALISSIPINNNQLINGAGFTGDQDLSGYLRNTTDTLTGTLTIDGGTGVSSTGTVLVRQNGDGSGNGITITSSNAVSHRIWKGVNGSLNIGPSSSPSSFVQTLAGNVGIRTNNPSTELSVNGAISAITSDYIQGTTGSRLLIHSAGTGNSHSYIQAQNSGGTSNAEDLALQLYGGNVGIGKDNPTEKLEVDGNILANNLSGTNTGDQDLSGYLLNTTDTLAGDLSISGGKMDIFRSAANYASGIADTLSRAGLVVKSSGNFDSKLTFSSGASSVQYIQALNNAATTGRDIHINPYGGNVITAGTMTASNFILSSDKRLKSNIQDVDNRHINVDWKTFELNSEKGQNRYGVIAQELEEAHPEFVRTDDDGMKSVAYIDLLIAKNAELEARLEKLERLLLDK